MLRLAGALSRALALCLMLATPLAANPGPPIPRPEIGLARAVEIAERAFAASPPTAGETGFVVQAVVYTDRLPGGARAAGWAWLVTFLHPVRNDRSFVFRVAGGEAELVQVTE